MTDASPVRGIAALTMSALPLLQGALPSVQIDTKEQRCCSYTLEKQVKTASFQEESKWLHFNASFSSLLPDTRLAHRYLPLYDNPKGNKTLREEEGLFEEECRVAFESSYCLL